MKRRVVTLAALAALAALLLTACGSSDSTSSSESGGDSTTAAGAVQADPAVVKLVPEKYAQAGKLTAQTDAASLPQAVVNEDNEMEGLVPELLEAAAAKMGLGLSLDQAPFDAQVPGVESGRYDFTTTTGDFKEREEVLDMVDYIKAGTAFYTLKDNPTGFDGTLPGLCGLRVAVTRGGLQDTEATEQSKKCGSEGKDPIEILRASTANLTLPLAAGRVDVSYDDAVTAEYLIANSDDQFELVGKPLILTPIGLGFRKDNTDLREAMVAALQSLVDDGTYGDIFAKWHETPFALRKITVNHATL